MSSSDIWYRMEVTSASHYRVVYRWLTLSIFLYTALTWPYQLPEYSIATLSISAVMATLIWQFHDTKHLARNPTQVVFVNDKGYLEDVDGMAQLQTTSVYLLGVYQLVLRNRLTGNRQRRLLFSDQLSEQNNRRLRRIIRHLQATQDHEV